MGNSTSSPFKHFINTNQETNPLDPLDTPMKPITQSKPQLQTNTQSIN